MHCIKCGFEVNENEKFCRQCGAEVKKIQPITGERCSKCNSMLYKEDSFCRTCGTPIVAVKEETAPVAESVTVTEKVSPSEEKKPEKKKDNGIKVLLIILISLFVVCAGVLIGLLVLHSNTPADVPPQPPVTPVTPAVPVEPAKPLVSSYQVIKADIDWETANYNCINAGGQLISINDEEEFAKACALAEEQGLNVFWAGASIQPGVLWTDTKWQDGSDFTLNIWYENEPTYYSQDGTEAENYLVVFKTAKQGWCMNDVPNDIAKYYKGKMGFICEYKN